jgi:DNA-binding MarR family transcriptional regulator
MVKNNMLPIWDFIKNLEPETEISMSELAIKTRKSRSLLVSSIRRFEELGLIHVNRSSKTGNSRRSNRYTVLKNYTSKGMI